MCSLRVCNPPQLVIESLRGFTTGCNTFSFLSFLPLFYFRFRFAECKGDEDMDSNQMITAALATYREEDTGMTNKNLLEMFQYVFVG